MSNEHPITPPPELVQQWRESAPTARDAGATREAWIATQAARWGWQQRDASVPEELQKARDEELEACTDAIYEHEGKPLCGGTAEWLRTARRPKPPGLAEKAFDAAKEMSDCMSHGFVPKRSSLDIIRRALERLQELENGNE